MARIEMLGSTLDISLALKKVKKQIYELGGCESVSPDVAGFASPRTLEADVFTKKKQY